MEKAANSGVVQMGRSGLRLRKECGLRRERTAVSGWPPRGGDQRPEGSHVQARVAVDGGDEEGKGSSGAAAVAPPGATRPAYGAWRPSQGMPQEGGAAIQMAHAPARRGVPRASQTDKTDPAVAAVHTAACRPLPLLRFRWLLPSLLRSSMPPVSRPRRRYHRSAAFFPAAAGRWPPL